MTFGNPPQTLRLQLSCSASDTWVNTDASSCASSDPSPCTDGVYDANSSKTYQYISSDFSEYSGDTFILSGDWAKDTVNVGNVNVTDMRFGIAYNTSLSPGVLGLGYGALETTNRPYQNVLGKLNSESFIDIHAFSLWTNQIYADHGEVLFGGVDQDKFYDTLATVAMTEDQGARISLDRVEINYNGQKTTMYDSPISVELDVYYGSMSLPPEITDPLFASFGVTLDDGDAYCSPSQLANTSTLDFVIGTKTISIAMSELIVPLNSSTSRFAASVGGSAQTDGAFYVLGNVFLRSAYVVFDWENQQISLAQSNFNSNSHKFEAIPAGGVQRLAHPSGVALPTGTPTPTRTGTATLSSSPGQTSLPATTSSSSSSSLSTGAKAGIGIGVSLGVLALLALIAGYFIVRRRRAKSTRPVELDRAPINNPRSPRQELESNHVEQYEMDSKSRQRVEADNRGQHLYQGMGYKVNRPSEMEAPAEMRYELDAS